ncbi:MAG TPA: hypothetical protein VEX64_08325, partial [Pyrinomonadaceae bacterium]|nr:hypothetical protein [Pyrinomonadaceae bacterium]
MKLPRTFQSVCALVLFTLLCFASVQAQTTAFTYQGKLSDSTPAGSVYDFQFNAYSALTGGSPVNGSPVTIEDVTVTNGVFNVKIDFGSSVFSGGDVYLEIGVRRGAETGAFTPLNPRQQIMSAPYAIRSLSATSVGAGTAGNSVVNAINDAATNVRINSNRLPADIVRLKPAAP